MVLFLTFIVKNTQVNMAKQNIASGFGFLSQEAGFEISESIIEYWADDTYRKALWVGLLNTFKVAVIGNILALFLGVFIGILRISPNWILKTVCSFYIEITRNVPLLLQLLFWYAMFTEVFPPVREAWSFRDSFFLSQRGFYFPTIEFSSSGEILFFSSFLLAIILCLFLFSLEKKKFCKRETSYNRFLLFLPVILLPLFTFIAFGIEVKVEYPKLGGFNFMGGSSVSPEFFSLMIGLVFYTAAFNAEIVRAGILSIPKGQWEAGSSLGLSRFQVLKSIVLPQSKKVIIPPLISQILNLIKNSSLAVGIGYPDFVAVANTTMNQTGQAIEAVLLIMIVYLIFSLTTSFSLNLYNKRFIKQGARS